MDKSKFVDTVEPWWLADEDLRADTAEIRQAIGIWTGWGPDWWLSEDNLTKFYDTLLGSLPDLITAAEQMVQPEERHEWLVEAATLFDPDRAADDTDTDETAAEGAGADELEADAPAGVASEEVAPAKPSVFGGGQIDSALVENVEVLLAEAIAAVDGAEELTPEEIAEIMAEVLNEL
ncbi:MAG TPA: hypothetical protein VG435_17430 [Acidimicrobiales bacterium]|jgi:hypothetical protein|nr:hypothetical protein [Acidimicrobiales bacterium]